MSIRSVALVFPLPSQDIFYQALVGEKTFLFRYLSIEFFLTDQNHKYVCLDRSVEREPSKMVPCPSLINEFLHKKIIKGKLHGKCPKIEFQRIKSYHVSPEMYF